MQVAEYTVAKGVFNTLTLILKIAFSSFFFHPHPLFREKEVIEQVGFFSSSQGLCFIGLKRTCLFTEALDNSSPGHIWKIPFKAINLWLPFFGTRLHFLITH